MTSHRSHPILLSLLLACTPDTDLSCGPGTHEEDGVCVPDAEPATGTGTTADVPTGGPTSEPSPTTGAASLTEATSTGTGDDGTTAASETGEATTEAPLCEPSFPPPVCDGDLLTGDALEPHEVYLAGTLSEGACYRDALAHWSTPDDAVGGFDCYFGGGDNARIRASDGRLVYSMTFEGLLREFHCDSCPIAPQAYPNTPLNNDVVLPTPACVPEDTTQMQFLLSPEGEHYYRCSQWEGDWYDAAGEVVYTSEVDTLLHIGRCGLALTTQAVVDLTSGTSAPIVGLPLGDPMTVRIAPEGGFWVVMTPEQPELWHVGVDGVATSLGLYPQVPPDHQAGKGVLDGCGGLYQITYGPEVFVDLILRREIGGDTETVYTEKMDPLVKIHISSLVTGP
jgi:hypothetical protein